MVRPVDETRAADGARRAGQRVRRATTPRWPAAARRRCRRRSASTPRSRCSTARPSPARATRRPGWSTNEQREPLHQVTMADVLRDHVATGRARSARCAVSTAWTSWPSTSGSTGWPTPWSARGWAKGTGCCGWGRTATGCSRGCWRRPSSAPSSARPTGARARPSSPSCSPTASRPSCSGRRPRSATCCARPAPRVGVQGPVDRPRRRGRRGLRGVPGRRRRPRTPPSTPTTPSPVLMMYTAAFTGSPNGALLSHRALVTQGTFIGLLQHVDADYVYLNCGPLFHVATFMTTLATFLAGGDQRVHAARRRRGAVPAHRRGALHRRVHHAADHGPDHRAQRRRSLRPQDPARLPGQARVDGDDHRRRQPVGPAAGRLRPDRGHGAGHVQRPRAQHRLERPAGPVRAHRHPRPRRRASSRPARPARSACAGPR